jgi:hypothetical protein
MMRCFTYIALLIIVCGLQPSAVAQSPTPRLRHKLAFYGSRDGGVYASFDERSFNTVDALRAAIRALPKGSKISYRTGYDDNPRDLKQFTEFARELPTFCKDRGITFVTLPMGFL